MCVLLPSQLNLLRLLSAPILLSAEDVMVIGTTQPPSAWSVEREQALRDQQRNLILLTDECLTYAREESGLPSLLQRATYAVIQRIRLSVAKLEVRLEDTETASKQHFAFGLRTSRLYNVRCDSKWEEQPQQSNKNGASCSGDVASPLASQDASPKSWFGWLRKLRNHQDIRGSDEKIPECFHLKTVMEQACLYLEPINDGHEHASWVPYPAAYRAAILQDVEKVLLGNDPSLKLTEATLSSHLRKPGQDAGLGMASALPLAALSQALLSKRLRGTSMSERRKPIPEDTDDDQQLTSLHTARREAALSKRRSAETALGFQHSSQEDSSGRPAATSGKAKDTKTHLSNAEARHEDNEHGLLRFSDLYCPTELWRIANQTGPHHLYIFKPSEVELRVRCVQRPTAPSPETERTFPRPFPVASYSNSGGNETVGSSQNTREPQGRAALTLDSDEEPLPAITITVLSRRSLLQFTPFQVACIFRWAHYAIILYQEFVSGVYAECL